MSSPTATPLKRLAGYKILPPPEGSEVYTLVLRLQSGSEFWCVSDNQSLLRLADALKTHVARPEGEKE